MLPNLSHLRLLHISPTQANCSLLHPLLTAEGYAFDCTTITDLDYLTPNVHDIWLVDEPVPLEQWGQAQHRLPPLVLLTEQAPEIAGCIVVEPSELNAALLRHALRNALLTHEALAKARRQLVYQVDLLQSVQEAVIATDADFCITSWNLAAMMMYGWAEREVLGQDINQLLQTEFVVDTEAQMREMLRMGKAWRGELWHTARDGRKLIIQSYAAPLWDAKGDFMGSVSVNRDIANFKQAQAQIEYQANLLQKVTDAIIATDAEFRITSWNKAAEAMYGWTAEEVLGRSTAELFQSQFATLTREEAVKQLFENGVWRGEVSQRRRDGKRIDVFISLALLKDQGGQPMGIVGINADITPIKEAEKQRNALLAERERVRVLDEFLGSATHDLVTPLTSIKTSLYLLQRGLEGQEKFARNLHNLEAQTLRLEKLLESMLSMTRLDSSAAELSLMKASLNDLLRDLLAQKLEQAQTVQHNFAVLIDPQVPPMMLDVTKIKRALDEIISNAILFTPAGGTIRVQSKMERHHIVVSIQDNGIGISEEDLPHIFERFYRADKSRHSETGTGGLGLSIAKRIVELHGGRIKVESKLGEGSTFQLILPIHGPGSQPFT